LELSMSEYLHVWRVRERDVEQLLELEPKSIAEAKQLCPDLLGADLVNLGDGAWFHVLRWSRPDGDEQLMRHADQFDAVERMHALMGDGEQIGRGEIVTGAA
jgi:hypothetical protein